MLRIGIISPSIRIGRVSHRAALYFRTFLQETQLAEPEILDLLDFNFPLFNERLKFQEVPYPSGMEFSEKVKLSDGIIIISPEYNGGVIASLKNAIDLLTDEWRRKPVAFVPVSDGPFGGSQVIIPLQFMLWKLGALTIPGPMRIPMIDQAFDPAGIPADKARMDKNAHKLIAQLLAFIEATKNL